LRSNNLKAEKTKKNPSINWFIHPSQFIIPERKLLIVATRII
jgi:hypothetical protein